MRCAAFFAALGTLCASQASLAQTTLADFGTGTFGPLAGPAAFAQTGPAGNVIGLVQTGPALASSITQTGFYNRAAIIEVATLATDASVTQTGDFSHALVVQISPSNTAAIVQNGSNGTAILGQSATSAITGLDLAGLSRLASNFLYAPENAAALPRLAEADNHGFARSLFDRLDAEGPRQCLVPAPVPLVSKDRAAVPAPPPDSCTLALFASGNLDTADRKGILGASGFSATAGRVSFGAEYEVGPGLVIGPIFDFGRTEAKFDRGSGRADLDSFHVGGYASYRQSGAFAHVVAAYGFDDYRLTRPGFAAPVSASVSGDSLVAAGKFGYLAAFGPLQIGPVGTLSYARGAVGEFLEAGDPLLTQHVAAQATRTLVGGGGVRVRVDVPLATIVVSPFLDVMAEHAHGLDGRRILSTAFSFALDQTLLTPVRPTDETYGRVVGGLGLRVAESVQVSVAAQGTFARPTGDAFAFTGGVKLNF